MSYPYSHTDDYYMAAMAIWLVRLQEQSTFAVKMTIKVIACLSLTPMQSFEFDNCIDAFTSVA